jgi:hypothetical protein
LVIVDEAAYVDPATWIALRPLVAATQGRVVVQSTPAHAEGDFYELATGEDPNWARLTVRSDEVSTISPEFLEAERRAMGPDAFDCEYMAVFGKAGASLFSAERLASLTLPEEAA